MEPTKGFFNSKTHDFVNLLASLIGILGFLTGVSNLPSILSGNGKVLVSWFESQISYWLSLPVLIITIFFVYGLYFLFLVQIYKWLKSHDTTQWNFTWSELLLLIRHGENLSFAETTLVSVFFFSTVGVALGGLIVQSFFGIGVWSGLQTYPIVMMIFLLSVMTFGVFLAGVCGAAQKVASHIVSEMKQSKEKKA